MGEYSEYCKRLNDECDWLARNFLSETHTDISIKWIDHDYYFKDDEKQRDIYWVKLTKATTKGSEAYSFKFGQSLANSSPHPFQRKRPKEYDILACLTATDPGRHEEFCWNYGYDEDSIHGLELYERVYDEFKNLSRLYSSEELAMLDEIR
jgi:hypothetical protein